VLSMCGLEALLRFRVECAAWFCLVSAVIATLRSVVGVVGAEDDRRVRDKNKRCQ
jgi:hypothetical protein